MIVTISPITTWICGEVGKPVVAAAMLHPFAVSRGVELVPESHAVAARVGAAAGPGLRTEFAQAPQPTPFGYN